MESGHANISCRPSTCPITPSQSSRHRPSESENHLWAASQIRLLVRYSLHPIYILLTIHPSIVCPHSPLISRVTLPKIIFYRFPLSSRSFPLLHQDTATIISTQPLSVTIGLSLDLVHTRITIEPCSCKHTMTLFDGCSNGVY